MTTEKGDSMSEQPQQPEEDDAFDDLDGDGAPDFEADEDHDPDAEDAS